MNNQFNMIQGLLIKKQNARLALFPYNGTPEVKEISGKKHLYIRKRELSKLKYEYVDVYSEELHNFFAQCQGSQSLKERDSKD